MEGTLAPARAPASATLRRDEAVTIARRARSRAGRIAAAAAACALGLGASSAVDPLDAAAPQLPGAAAAGSVEIVTVRPNVFMIAGAGGNIAVQVGDDGVVLVDAGSAASAPAVIAAIKQLTPKPIR